MGTVFGSTMAESNGLINALPLLSQCTPFLKSFCFLKSGNAGCCKAKCWNVVRLFGKRWWWLIGVLIISHFDRRMKDEKRYAWMFLWACLSRASASYD